MRTILLILQVHDPARLIFTAEDRDTLIEQSGTQPVDRGGGTGPPPCRPW